MAATTDILTAPTNTLPEHNRTGISYRRPMPRAKVRGSVIDAHCHLLADRHADLYFAVADHFNIDLFFSMGPLDEAMALQRRWGHRIHFIAVPNWQRLTEPDVIDTWMRHLEAFYNLGSRIAKLHMAPGTIKRTGLTFDHPGIQQVLHDIRDRGMIIMTHVGDPQIWYDGKYNQDPAFGTREKHYALWEEQLEAFRGTPWIGAHLGGNPEDLVRLQSLLDRFPDLVLDLSATRWIVREVGARRDEMREFIVRNQNRLLWGSDQVTGDTRDWDFLASRWWAHRKLWETAYNDTTPIYDPDLPADRQPRLHGLALPDQVIQKIYHDNAANLMKKVGVRIV